MARYRLTLVTSQPDNDPVPELLREAAEYAASFAADALGEDVVFDTETGVRTAGARGAGVASPGSLDSVLEDEDDADEGESE